MHSTRPLLLNGHWLRITSCVSKQSLMSPCIITPLKARLTLPAGGDMSRRVLYGDFLAKNFNLKVPFEQYVLYLSCNAGLLLLGRNFFKACHLLEIEACTELAKKLDLHDWGNFKMSRGEACCKACCQVSHTQNCSWCGRANPMACLAVCNAQ